MLICSQSGPNPRHLNEASGSIMGSGYSYSCQRRPLADCNLRMAGHYHRHTALSMVYAGNDSRQIPVPAVLIPTRAAASGRLGYQTNVLYWLACWIGNIAMVVIGVGYLSYYFFPILKDPLVLAAPASRCCDFVLLNIVGPMITRG